MEPPFIDRELLKAWLERELWTQVSQDAIDAIEHSMRCVMKQHARAAGIGIRKEVMQQLVEHEFEGLPTLQPYHFLPRYQRLNQFGQVEWSGYEPGPRV